MRKTLLASVLALTCSFGFTTAADAASAKETRYLVRFKNEAQTKKIVGHEAVVTHLQTQLEKNLSGIKKFGNLKNVQKIWAANAIAVQATADEAKTLSRLPNVDEVRPVQSRIWIDKDIEKQEVRADSTAPQWSIAKVRAPEAWEKYKIDGTGVLVGLIDTGVYAQHPALAGKVLGFKDFTKAQKPEAYDDQGHGSHCAGSILGGNGVGVAPGARLIAAKVFDAQGSGEDADLLLAMQWMLDPDGNPATNDAPQIVSNSWGSDVTTDKVFWEVIQHWVDAGMLPVFAAGNNGPSGKVGTPGGYPHSWAVAATTKTDTIAYFSSIGPSVWDGVTLVKPDIAAPGHGVISCSTSGGLVSNSGTSMACPHVSGLAALMLQAKPDLKIDEIRSIAESTAVDLGTPGKDIKFGAGRFDATACIGKVLGQTSLESAFAAYPAALEAERALIGVQAASPLAAPLARSLVIRSMDLDEGQFRSLQSQFAGNPATAALLKEAAAARTSRDLQK